jgi:hypothetical protein
VINRLYNIKLLLILCSVSTLVADVAFFPFRSQSRNNVRKLVGTTSYHTDLFDMDSVYGTVNAAFEIDTSFKSHRITNFMFGSSMFNIPATPNPAFSSDGKNSCHFYNILQISGLNVPAELRTPKDWMAENFLLPSGFLSNVTFKPFVESILLDIDMYIGFDKWVKGLYFRLYGPITNCVSTTWPCEKVISTGSQNPTEDSYPAGFFGAEGVPPLALMATMLDYLGGNTRFIPGINFSPLAYSIIDCRFSSKTSFADLRAEFGWNYAQERYRVGFNLQVAAPTGNRPDAVYLLPPQIGNGKHWELGVGLKGLMKLWQSEDQDHFIDLILEADITHLFKAKQRRTFDLKGKPSSRYMLAQQLANNDDDTNSGFQFTNTYSPVANFSTHNVKVSVGAQADLVVMLTYTGGPFSWDFGYNFWGMSKEKINLGCCDARCTIPFTENTWALKGDASVAGRTAAGAIVFLGATENNATIHAGTNQAMGQNILTNPNVDNGEAALQGTTPVFAITVTPNTAINTSVPPTFIKASDFDVKAAEMRGFSNKAFTYLSYSLVNNPDRRWTPYIGIGASAEFGSHSHIGVDSSASSTVSNSSSMGHNSFALSQWAIFFKGGATFN